MRIKFLLFIFVICLTSQVQSQLNTSYFFNDFGSRVGVGYQINKTFSLETNVYAANDFEELSPEFLIRGNVLGTEKYKIYLGAGVITNLYHSVVFPIGVDLKMFSMAPEFRLKFEANIMAGIDGNPNMILPTLGITYVFGK